uniref:Uncharacterized protein n=1 Tax=Solanum lycopersicum TaxID=4081 RepID=A0A3Q7EL43_SOLLC
MGVEFQHPTPFPSRKKASSKFDVNFPTEPNNPINLSDFEENTGSFIGFTKSYRSISSLLATKKIITDSELDVMSQKEKLDMAFTQKTCTMVKMVNSPGSMLE